MAGQRVSAPEGVSSNTELVPAAYCHPSGGGQQLTAYGSSDSWHKTEDWRKLPDAVILGTRVPNHVEVRVYIDLYDPPQVMGGSDNFFPK